MKAVGMMGVSALGVGLTVFGLESARAPAQERSGLSPRLPAVAQAPAPPVAEPLTIVLEEAPATSRSRPGRNDRPETEARVVRPLPPPRQVARPAPPPPQEAASRRRARWRDYNRYPGAIPTPAEWRPPDGPVRIALQAGHWRADEAPRELSGLRDNGTQWRGMPEWQVNLAIARSAARMLEEIGYEVDVLPAVVPPDYRSHLFVAIHADGATDPAARGYRVAAPRRDATGRASRFARLLEGTYGDATGLRRLPTVTRRMQNYYAFNYRRYQHALHPMTIGVIIETGFLTSATDRGVIVDEPDRAARGIVEAVLAFEETPPPPAPSRGR